MVAGPPPKPGEPPTSVSINGYNYSRLGVEMVNPFGATPPPDDLDTLVRWRRDWIPEVDRLAAKFGTFEPEKVPAGSWEETIAAQEKDYMRVFAGVHRTAVGPARQAVSRFQDGYVQRFGEGRRQDANALLQGFPNRSLDRAAALWDLGRILAANPDLRLALDRKGTLPSTPAARDFNEKFQAMLRDFGQTTDNGQIDMPTWQEGSPIPLAIARAYARQASSRAPRVAADTSAQKRLVLEDELRGLAPADPTLTELLRLMEMAQQLMPNLEDHNLICDQGMLAASRGRWLSIGRTMVKRELAASADDIFFHRRPEMFDALERGIPVSAEELRSRRRMQELYRLTPPPLTLGKPLPDSGNENAIPEEAVQGRSIRGVAASAGSYRGRARIIESLAAAATLKEGEVMVVRSTTPPWTPYFGVIGALVTNSGGALSHGAVVAREFGLPAVVGTKNGTAVIPEGAMVTVDGTTGLVLIE